MVIFAVSFKPVSQQESICGQRNQIQEEPESKARKSVNACLPQRTQLCRLRVSETGTAGLSNGRAVRGTEMRTDGVSPLRGHQKTPRPVQRKLKENGLRTRCSDRSGRQHRSA